MNRLILATCTKITTSFYYHLFFQLPDINECDTDNGGCDHNCTDSIGSYDCSCDIGYILATDNHGCNGKSINIVIRSPNQSLFTDINECNEGTDICEQVCNNTIGSYLCECHIGYQLDANAINCSG